MSGRDPDKTPRESVTAHLNQQLLDLSEQYLARAAQLTGDLREAELLQSGTANLRTAEPDRARMLRALGNAVAYFHARFRRWQADPSVTIGRKGRDQREWLAVAHAVEEVLAPRAPGE